MTDNLRPPYCCGACPPIEGGGYDCTCLWVKDCPKRKEHTMWDNLRWRIQIWWGHVVETIATRAWARKRRKRYENLEPSDD